MAEHNLRAAAFPKLGEEQLAELAKCPNTKLRHFRDGEFLFEAGQRDYSFFIIKSGRVEIFDKTGDAPKTVVVHEPGQFTGEVAQLTGSPALVSGVARGECDVFEISPEALHQLLNRHLDLADVILQAFIARRQLLRESGEFVGLRVVGSRDSQDTFRVRDFLAKNRIPFTWIDLNSDPDVKRLLAQFQFSEKETPVVAWGAELLLRNPSNLQLAQTLGMRRPLAKTAYDLIVVGGGPAGLAAAVYGASEGLRVAVLERVAPGGQAGRSMRIENYLGFPAGISGSDLAERAVVQANRFGACLPVGTQVNGLTFNDGQMVLQIDGDESVRTKCLLIATGADYRLLSAEGCAIRRLRSVLRRHSAGSANVPRFGSGCGWRRQFGRPGRCFSGEPGSQSLSHYSRRQSLQEHVELSGRSGRTNLEYRGDAKHRSETDVWRGTFTRGRIA